MLTVTDIYLNNTQRRHCCFSTANMIMRTRHDLPVLLSSCANIKTCAYIKVIAELLELLIFLWRCGPTRSRSSSFTRFLDHTQRHITVGRTPLDEWLARRRDLYLTTHNTHNRQTSMPPVGFEPTISAGERPQTYALDRAATGTGIPTSNTWKYRNLRL